MKIPNKLKIGGHTYKVFLKKEWEDSKDEDGYCDVTKNEIVLKASMSQSCKEVTLLHEIFHALNSVLDHTVMDSLSEQLYQVLKDNKLLK